MVMRSCRKISTDVEIRRTYDLAQHRLSHPAAWYLSITAAVGQLAGHLLVVNVVLQ